MEHRIMEVEKERFSLADENCYMIWGTWDEGFQPELFLDKTKIEKAISYKAEEGYIEIRLNLSKDWEQYRKVSVYGRKGNKKILWFSEKTGKLLKKRNMPQYYIDYADVDYEQKKCMISGWAVYGRPLEIYVESQERKPMEFSLDRVDRTDVRQQYPEADVGKECGFFCEFSFDKEKGVRLVFSSGGHRSVRYISLQKRKMYGEKVSFYYHKGVRYFRLHGAKGFAAKLVKKAEDYKTRPYPYGKWYPRHAASEDELRKQREKVFAYQPLISIVIPLYNTPAQYLKELVDSVLAQTYGNFQLCLADGSDNDKVQDCIQELYAGEKRITYKRLENNGGISANTNGAIELAKGDFIMFSDHDDTLAPNALYEIVREINENPGTDVVYTDEDKVTMDGRRYYDPHFKPDFNLDMLRSNNYICHIFVVKREVLEKAGMLRSQYDGAQDYDFILRCCEQAEKIRHVAKILYHWRNHPASTAGNPESKMYAYEAGRAAVQAHYDRLGIEAKVTMTENWGRYRTELPVQGEPLVSVIIPNKDHKEELQKCVESIYEKSTYPNFEIILVENNSTTDEIFQYYEELKQQHANLKVLEWKDGFNYSAINNFAVGHAEGEYILLLNNDVEVITENWIEEMLGYCQREDVGAVGARLLYPNDRIQHAGVIIGMGQSGTAGHIFHNLPKEQFSYAGRTQTTQDLSAVTAACMMVKKSLYQELQGLDEDFRVAFNDIDFCLRIREKGLLVVYQAYVELYHYESLTRGYDKSAENKKRFEAETKRFKSKWAEVLEKKDPYYNPNFSLLRNDCSLQK